MFNYMLSKYKKAVFHPLKTIASALWHLLLSPTAFAIPPFGFSSLPSGVYHSSFMVYSPLWCLLFYLLGFASLPSGVCYFILLPILRHLPSCLPVFTSPPSSGFCSPLRCLLFCFSGSATLIRCLLSHLPTFVIPPSALPPAFLLLWSFVQKSPHLRPCLTDKRMCF